jgi:hypothetical protein
MKAKQAVNPNSEKSGEVEASFAETNPIVSTPTQTDTTAELTWPLKQPILVQNSNHQYQFVSQDNTTINNLFRTESKGWKDFLVKLVTELLLSVIEPDRFLKNAKAILLLVIAYVVSHLSYDEIKKLLELYFSHTK